MTEDQVKELLDVGKEKLLSLVPVSNRNDGKLHMQDYRKLRQIHPQWYFVVSSLAHKINSSKRRAKKMKFDFNLTLEYIVELWIDQQGKCPMTGVLMAFDSGSQQDKNYLACSVDRIHNEFGYIKGNVVLTTHWANNAKNTWGRDIYEKMIFAAAKKLSEPCQLSLF